MTDQTPQTSQDVADEALAQQTQAEVDASNDLAETVTSLQNLIERHANKLDEINDKLKMTRQQLRDAFENDAELAEAKEQADQYKSQVRERRSKLKSDPAVVGLETRKKELLDARRDLQETLSDHLVNFYQLTNSKSFDTSDGDQREFKIVAKVK